MCNLHAATWLYKTLQSVPRIWTNKARFLFSSQFLPLYNRASFLEVAGAVLKIGSGLKPNHHQKVKIAQIGEMFCSIEKKEGG